MTALRRSTSVSSVSSQGSSDAEFDMLPRQHSIEKVIVGTFDEGDAVLDVCPQEVEEARRGLAILSEHEGLGGGAVMLSTQGVGKSSVRRALKQLLSDAGKKIKLRQYHNALRCMVSGNRLATGPFQRSPEIQTDVPATYASATDATLISHTISGYNDLKKKIISGYEEILNSTASTETHEQRLSRIEQEVLQLHAEGLAKRAAQDFKGSLINFYKILSLRRSSVGEVHPGTAIARSFIATLLRDQGDMKGALTELRAVLEIQEQVLSASDPQLAVTLNNVGATLKQQGQPQAAIEHHEKAFDILASYYKTQNHAFCGEVQEHIGHASKMMCDYERARRAYQTSLNIRYVVLGGSHPKTLKLLERLAALPPVVWPAPKVLKSSPEQSDEPMQDWACTICYGINMAAATTCQCGNRKIEGKQDPRQLFVGKTLAFSGVLPKSLHPSVWEEWRCAWLSGAKVVEEVTQDVDAVVYKEGFDTSEKVARARQEGVPAVPSTWFYACLEWGVLFDVKLFEKRVGRQGRGRACSAPPRGCKALLVVEDEALPPPRPLVGCAQRASATTPVPMRPMRPVTPQMCITTQSGLRRGSCVSTSTWGCSSAFSTVSTASEGVHTEAISTPWGTRKVHMRAVPTHTLTPTPVETPALLFSATSSNSIPRPARHMNGVYSTRDASAARANVLKKLRQQQ